MPPPQAVADGKVKALTDEDRFTLVRWIDLGCPIDLDYDSARPERTGSGWMLDDQRPTLTLALPQPGANGSLSRIVVGMNDYESGLDMGSLQIVADFEIDGIKAGANLASRLKAIDPGVWEMKLAKPLTTLSKGLLSVSIKDKQGNITRIDRTFKIDKKD